MFQFRRFPSHTYLIQYGIPCGGFPHSEISGSQLICSSPKLIAAYHVLHRLLMPRHSPCALISLTFVEIDEANSANPAWLTPCVIRSLASSFLLSNQNPLTLGFWFVKRTKARCSLRSLFNTSQLIDSPIGSLYSWIMQAHVSRSFLAKNCIFTHLSFEIETEKKFPLLLPSHNCIIITMFSFQGTWWVSFSRDSMKFQLPLELQSISFEVVEISGIEPLTSWMPFKRSPSWAIPPYLPRKWWAKMDSNHRPHDYQSCALASWAIGPFCLLLSKVHILCTL